MGKRGALAVGLGLVALLVVGGCDLLTGNRRPTAIIEAAPLEGPAPLTVSFDGSRSFDANDLITKFEWSFGDGTRAEGPKVSHTYAREGIYRATLTVTDSFGATGRSGVQIVVGNPPPQAIFTASPTSGWAPLTVAFDASASFDPTGDGIVSFEWDFGDGTGAQDAQAVHVYEIPGRYDVVLRVTDREGGVSEASLGIHVLGFSELERPGLSLGRSPADVLVRDFDGDGALDLVVAHSGDDEIALFFGQVEPGAFSEWARLPAGRRPVALEAADFDGDGRTDLAVASLDSGSVSVFMNGGHRNFHSAGNVQIGRWASAAAAARFDSDGSLDLAVADPGTQQVVVLSGDGTGRFAVAGRFPVDRWPSSLVARDLNGDGLVDLAVASFLENTVALFYGDGHWGFQAGEVYPVGEGPLSLRVADFNGDDLLDLATADSRGATITVLMGRAGGRFVRAPFVPAGEGVRALAPADFDGDGRPDLAAANGLGHTITIHLNDGAGRFRVADARTYPVPGSPNALAAGDVDRDGFPDLVAVHFGTDRLSILLNRL